MVQLTQDQVQALLNKGGVVALTPGIYRFEKLNVPKGSVLDGQGSTFEGSKAIASTAWKTSGDFNYTPYVGRPVKDGHGISFSTGMNLNDPLGKYSDQVWTRAEGDTRLRRVSSKAALVPGKFLIENGNLWVHKLDKAKGILVSDKSIALSVSGEAKNLLVKRYSPSPADNASVNVSSGKLTNVSIDSSSFVAASATGTDVQLQNVSITRAGWMGVAAVKATNLVLKDCTFDKINDKEVFTWAPQSGALKTSRCRQVTVLNTKISNTYGHGLWFDQSTSDVLVQDCNIVSAGSALFFEISHLLTLLDSSLKSTEHDGVKIAGASGVMISNNLIVGARHAVGIYVDKRSRKGWSDPLVPLTSTMKAAGVYSSDRRPTEWRDLSITWMPEVRVLERNALSSGKAPTVFILTQNGDASVTLASIIPNGHQ